MTIDAVKEEQLCSLGGEAEVSPETPPVVEDKQ